MKAESDIFTIVCRYPQGMSYDEIYQKIDRDLPRNGPIQMQRSAVWYRTED